MKHSFPTSVLRVPLLAALLPVAAACAKYPDMDSENTRQLVALSYFDPETDYTRYRTFYISDSMGVISDKQGTAMVSNARSRALREKVAECMEAAGYVLVNDTAQADLDLSMIEMERTNYTISADIYYPYYWDTYSFWGYGYFYPSYIPQYYISSIYSTETLSIQMGDRGTLKTGQDGKQSIQVVWIGLVKGLNGQDRPQSEICEAIEECFAQTPLPPFSIR